MRPLRLTPVALACVLTVATPAVAAFAARTYQVRPGDTLSQIAERTTGHARLWGALYRRNHPPLVSARIIRVGQRLRLLNVQEIDAALHRTRMATLPGAASASVVATLPASATVLPLGIASSSLAPVVAAATASPVAADPRPWIAAGASLALPGAGQAVNGQYGKAAAFAAATAALYGLAYASQRTFNPTLGQACGIGILAVSVGAPVDAFLNASPTPNRPSVAATPSALPVAATPSIAPVALMAGGRIR